MGRVIPMVPHWTGRYVVANKSCSSISIQGSTQERRTNQGWDHAYSILHCHLNLQLHLLCLPWLPLSNVNFSVLDMLDISLSHPSPTTCFGSLWTWGWCYRTWLVYYLCIPWKPTCKFIVYHNQCCCWICFCHVCFNSHMLLAQRLQFQYLSFIFQ